MGRVLRLLIMMMLISSVIALGKNIYNQATRFKDIYNAEQKAALLERQNEGARERLEAGKENFFVEEQARNKLGYQREGEVLYVTSDEAEREAAAEKEKTNWRQWLDFLLADEGNPPSE